PRPPVAGLALGPLSHLIVLLSPNVSLTWSRHPRILPSTVKRMATRTGQAFLDSGGGLLRSSVWSYVGVVFVLVIVVIVAKSPERRTGLALVASAAVSV